MTGDQPAAEEPPSAGETRQFRVANETGSVQVRKYRTKRGERAEIAAGDDVIRLDALILESLSWQRSREDLATQVDAGALVRTDRTPVTGGDPTEQTPTIQITNEYAQVELCHSETPEGEVLTVRTPARGSELNLGVASLRALARQPETFAFSEFFKTPVGPEDTPVEGPH